MFNTKTVYIYTKILARFTAMSIADSLYTKILGGGGGLGGVGAINIYSRGLNLKGDRLFIDKK